MPQTRFVLKKALGLHKTPLVVVNKIDRDGARQIIIGKLFAYSAAAFAFFFFMHITVTAAAAIIIAAPGF